MRAPISCRIGLDRAGRGAITFRPASFGPASLPALAAAGLDAASCGGRTGALSRPEPAPDHAASRDQLFVGVTPWGRAVATRGGDVCRKALPQARAKARPGHSRPPPRRSWPAPRRRAGGGAGARVRALFQPGGHRSVRRGRMGDAVGGHRQREGGARLRAARRRDPAVLVAAGHQHRGVEVLPRPDRHARSASGASSS